MVWKYSRVWRNCSNSTFNLTFDCASRFRRLLNNLVRMSSSLPSFITSGSSTTAASERHHNQTRILLPISVCTTSIAFFSSSSSIWRNSRNSFRETLSPFASLDAISRNLKTASLSAGSSSRLTCISIATEISRILITNIKTILN